MALVNDYFSLDKVYVEYLRKGPANGRLYFRIKLLMDQHEVSVGRAKDMVRQIIVQYDQEYVRLRDEWASAEERQVELKRYVEQMGLMPSGSLYWHSKAPRYHDLGSLEDLPQEHVKAEIIHDGGFVNPAIVPDRTHAVY
jgi:hypothetical protein